MDWLLQSHLMDAAVCLGLLVACVSFGAVMQWLSEVETASEAKTTRPHVSLTPCDICGKVEGDLLAIGMWHADGPSEGTMIEVEHYVLCRHCREQSFAECEAVLNSRLTVG